MLFKLEKTIDVFILFIFFIKIVFILSAFGHIILSHSDNYNLKQNIDPKFVYWKERTEFIFITSMSILLIYYFLNPSQLN
jgi:hypothetical protein